MQEQSDKVGAEEYVSPPRLDDVPGEVLDELTLPKPGEEITITWPTYTEPMSTRYILMRYDKSGANLAYLYEYAHPIYSICRPPKDGVLVVELALPSDQPEVEDRLDYLARYQAGRLASGMESRAQMRAFTSLAQAIIEARKIARLA